MPYIFESTSVNPPTVVTRNDVSYEVARVDNLVRRIYPQNQPGGSAPGTQTFRRSMMEKIQM